MVSVCPESNGGPVGSPLEPVIRTTTFGRLFDEANPHVAIHEEVPHTLPILVGLSRRDDLGDARVRDQLRTREARNPGDVDRAALALLRRRIEDRVRFGVYGHAAVVAPATRGVGRGPRARALVAVGMARRGAVVPGRPDTPVLDDHGTVLPARAVRARSGLPREIQEVLVPVGGPSDLLDPVSDAHVLIPPLLGMSARRHERCCGEVPRYSPAPTLKARPSHQLGET